VLVCLLVCLAAVQAQATVKVVAWLSEVTFDGTVLNANVTIQPLGARPRVTLLVSANASAIADTTALVDALKNRIITYATEQGFTITPDEILVIGGLQ
jgi:hypothetical protein